MQDAPTDRASPTRGLSDGATVVPSKGEVVEAEELVCDREDVDRREAGALGVARGGGGAHDGAGRGGRCVGSPDRQAVQDAGRVHESLDGIFGWRLERFGDLFVHDQVDRVGLAESAHGRERLDRSGQVVDHLEGHDEVVGAERDRCRQVAGDIDDCEAGSVPDTGFGGFVETVTEWDQPNRLQFTIVDCNLPTRDLTHTYTLDATPNGTSLSQVMRYDTRFDPFGTILNRVMIRRKSDQGVQGFLAGLNTTVTNAQSTTT